VALADQMQAEGLDEGRFSDPRHAGDTEPHGLARIRQERRLQCLGRGAVVGAARFRPSDGAG
jgi:hypothetical protein